ncbi:hypothetical protein [Achromobacter sp. Root83]|uniref:hypothetical protein n=1 Tax=Achromobacter sp. Root83 TaxID=1736602 RepID=UPI000B26129A|nr:hypothetical protein [Achromobacter sp. Root83]
MAFSRAYYGRNSWARGAAAGLLAATLAALPPAIATAAPQQNAPAQAAVAPPDGGTVLYFIHQIDGKGATSYEVANGSIATYWFGHAFELGGTQYFTGFVWETAERYGNPGEDNVGPGTLANLAEATFILANPSSDRPWKFRGMEHTIGEFGAYERAPEVDTERKPLEHRTASGKLVLAVPTASFDNGITTSGYAMFVFTPPDKRQDDTNDKVWAYVGSVLTGEDNSLACADGEVMPCTNSSGELSFSANGSSDLPLLNVKLSGTTIAGPDKTRRLGPADAVAYAYDSASKAYAPR